MAGGRSSGGRGHLAVLLQVFGDGRAVLLEPGAQEVVGFVEDGMVSGVDGYGSAFVPGVHEVKGAGDEIGAGRCA